MNRIELLERLLYFIQNEIYLDISQDKMYELGNIFSKLYNDPIYKYVDKQLQDNLTDDKDIISWLKGEIRELKIENIINNI